MRCNLQDQSDTSYTEGNKPNRGSVESRPLVLIEPPFHLFRPRELSVCRGGRPMPQCEENHTGSPDANVTAALRYD